MSLLPIKKTSVGNYRFIVILNIFSKDFFKFITHSHFVKLNSFIKSKYTLTNYVDFLNFVSLWVCSQGQTDSIYFELNNAFHILAHSSLHNKPSKCGLASDYLSWFLSYLKSRQFQVCYSGIIFRPFVVQSGVPQGSVFGPFLFNIFINDLCDITNQSNSLLFSEGRKIYQAISSPSDCFLLESDIDCVHKWRSKKFMKSNLSYIIFISFTRKTNFLNYQYTLRSCCILRTYCIKDLSVIIDCNFIFIVMSIFFRAHWN